VCVCVCVCVRVCVCVTTYVASDADTEHLDVCFLGFVRLRQRCCSLAIRLSVSYQDGDLGYVWSGCIEQPVSCHTERLHY